MELACHRITAFSRKSKGVLHYQEDGIHIFPSQLHNVSELCAFHAFHAPSECSDCMVQIQNSCQRQNVIDRETH